ncbi:chorismate-binding protein [Winogradskyella ouciana]|uniref:chorismate-binding protein n=1 Tax=Winogradskyella ouciana TaxID=2608631 RepID=UPI003D2A78F9
MTVDSFFETLENQYKNQLPFAVYSRPINSVIKCWLQYDDALHTTSNFTESGFVFAPFDLNNDSILLPQEHCQHYTLEASHLDLETEINTTSIDAQAKDNHLALVSKGIETIKKGDLEKVVLSRLVKKATQTNNPLAIFKRLFNTYKNAMVYCWYHPKIGLWLGATPELLFKLEGKQLTTIALAGTQATQTGKEVSWNAKEIEEQQIVVDYIKKQIEPYSSKVNVTEAETVKAGSLLHLKSRVTSRINDTTDLKSIIEALHPTPAVCGYPKEASKEFILHHENYNREYYTGFLGELNLKHSRTRNTNRRNVENNAYTVVKTQSNFYVNLRCMQIKHGDALIYVGGGITKDSVSENEWEETVNKTKTINKVLE